MTPTNEIEARSTWDNVRRMTDEVELKIHLGGMEMRDRWKALAPRLRVVEKAFESSAKMLAASVKEELQSLQASMKDLRDELAKRSLHQTS